MLIADRLRAIRETKKLSQGDIEKRAGLKRSYISRMEGGHSVPSVETLERWVRALEVPLYQLFYEGEKPPKLPNLPNRKTADKIAWGRTGKEARFWSSSASCSAAWTNPGGSYCFTWRRRWPGARSFQAGMLIRDPLCAYLTRTVTSEEII